jgi:peptidoglycan/LPS O-acetylase OafA/YrhL
VFMHMQYTAGLDKLHIGKVLHYGQQGVAVFFVISGFIIPYSLWNSNYERKNFFKYIFKRLVRIDPPYLMVLLICLLFGSIYNLYQFDFLKVIFHLAYLIPFSNYDWYQSVFWTLGLEFQFYILIGLLFHI